MTSKTKLLSHVGSYLSVAMLCVACGGGGGSSSTPSSPTTVTPPATPTTVPSTGPVGISGTVTFEDVPASSVTDGLNFNAITNAPVRGVTVEALGTDGNVLATGQTDSNGGYSLSVPNNTSIAIRVSAEMIQTTGTTWNVRVQDNTNNDALYAFQGSFTSSGTTNSIRNLNADSGWGGSSYTGPRVAGPFAILDPIYDTLQAFAAVAPGVNFPDTDFNWSVNNTTAFDDFDFSDGEIGSSNYSGNGQIFILGEEDVDTDEYDEDVVVHEWGHYFEDMLSRSDSIGGAHGLGDRIDFRLALSEGFGNAIAAIINDDVLYRDSLGDEQDEGFSFNVENQPNVPNNGWFSETSVQEIIFDIFDSANDAGDTVSLGLGPIFNAMTSPAYTENTVFTTIYTFMDAVITQNPANAAGLEALLTEQNISGTGPTGVGETNSGGISETLPVYKVATINGPPVVVCSSDDTEIFNPSLGFFGNASPDFNGLGVRDYITFTRTSLAPITMQAQIIPSLSGTTNVDPDFFVFSEGTQIAQAISAPSQEPAGTETLTNNSLQNQLGDLVIEVFDFDNVDDTLSDLGTDNDGDSCYNFTITQ